MQTERTLSRFERTMQLWLSRLEPRNDEDMARPPADGGWCIGQVCDHVLVAGAVILDQVQLCIDGEAEEVGFRWKPALICAYGSIPPMRIRVPRVPALEAAARPATLTKSEALAGFGAFAARTRALVEPAAAAPRNLKRPHPIVGHFNAAQWFRFNEMHLRHHLRQLARLR
ncbi:MAG: DinB family protein [Planctomycetota bacterium]